MAYQQHPSTPSMGAMDIDQIDTGAILSGIDQGFDYGLQTINPACGNSQSQQMGQGFPQQMDQRSSQQMSQGFPQQMGQRSSQQMGQGFPQQNGNSSCAPVVGTHHFHYGGAQGKTPAPVAPMPNRGPGNFDAFQSTTMGYQNQVNSGAFQSSMMGNQAHGNINNSQAPMIGNQVQGNSGGFQSSMMRNQVQGNSGGFQSSMMGNQAHGNINNSQSPMMGNQVQGNSGGFQSSMMGNQAHGNIDNSQASMMGNGQGPFTSTCQPNFMAANQAVVAKNTYGTYMDSNMRSMLNGIDEEFRQREKRSSMNNTQVNGMQVAPAGNSQTPPMNDMHMSGMAGIRTPAVNSYHASQQKMSTLSPTAPAFIPNQINMVSQQSATPFTGNMRQQSATPSMGNMRQQSATPSMGNMHQQSATPSMGNMHQQSATPSMGGQMQMQVHQPSRSHTKKKMSPKKNMQSQEDDTSTTSTANSMQIKRQAYVQQAWMQQNPGQPQCSQSSAGDKGKQPAKKQVKEGSKPRCRVPGTRSTLVHTPETTRSTSMDAILGMTNTSLATEMSTEPHNNDLLEPVLKHSTPKSTVPQQPTQLSAKRSSADASTAQDPEPAKANKDRTNQAMKKRIVREQYVSNAKTNGDPIPPSRRRMVVLDPNDPRCILKGGLPTAPAPDAYNVYTIGPPFTPNELNLMVSELAGMSQSRIPTPPSENVTSKKRRKISTAQTVATDVAAFHAPSAAQSIPDNSVTTQSASPDTIPSLTSDESSNTQSSPLDGNLSQADGNGLLSSLQEPAVVNYGDQPAVSTDYREIASPPEPVKDTNNYGDQPAAFTDYPEIASSPGPVKDTNNSANAVSALPSGDFVCPQTGVDLGPLVDLSSFFQHDASPATPAHQDTQLEIDPALSCLVAEDNSHAHVPDPEAIKGQAVQAATALPKTAGADDCAPQEQDNASLQFLATESHEPPQEQQIPEVFNELDGGSGEQSMVSVPVEPYPEIICINDEHIALIDKYNSGAPLEMEEGQCLVMLGKAHYPYIDVLWIVSRLPEADRNGLLDHSFCPMEISLDNLDDEFEIADPNANSNDGILHTTEEEEEEEEDDPFSHPSEIPGFNFPRGIDSPHPNQDTFASFMGDEGARSLFPRVATYSSRPMPQFEPHDPHSITLGGCLPD
ncbi:hypothetical protein ACHAPU_001763 [Fusarium lateritium]